MSFRSGRLRGEVPEEVAEFTSSLEFDREIYKETLVINAVHLKMLARLGLIGGETLTRGLASLREAYDKPLGLDEPRHEDVHMVVEEYLAGIVPEAGENLALGKSRNDTVATAIRMRAKAYLVELADSTLNLAEALLEKSLAGAETVYPATTHLQVAAPASLGFILTGYASRLLSALDSLTHAYDSLDLCPQGAAAVSGSTLPIDRDWLAAQLGFRGVLEHALEASSSRDFIIDLLATALRLSIIASDLAEQLILDFTAGLIDMGDEFCSTSSIMPQKRNPVVLEIVRTKSSEALGSMVKAASMIQRRAGGYVLDLQQVTPAIWHSLREVERSMEVLAKVVASLRVDEEGALRRCGPEASMVELANFLVLKFGVGFRRAHRACGEIARMMVEKRLTEDELCRVLRSLGVTAELRMDDVLRILDPRSILSSYATKGSASPAEVGRMAEEMRRKAAELRSWAREKRGLIERVLTGAFIA